MVYLQKSSISQHHAESQIKKKILWRPGLNGQNKDQMQQGAGENKVRQYWACGQARDKASLIPMDKIQTQEIVWAWPCSSSGPQSLVLLTHLISDSLGSEETRMVLQKKNQSNSAERWKSWHQAVSEDETPKPETVRGAVVNLWHPCHGRLFRTLKALKGLPSLT